MPKSLSKKYEEHFWWLATEAGAGSDIILPGGGVATVFNVLSQDRREFPELEHVMQLKLWEDDEGVHCVKSTGVDPCFHCNRAWREHHHNAEYDFWECP